MVETNKGLLMENVLSYRTKVTQQEFPKVIHRINEVIIQSGAKKWGHMTTVTYGVEDLNGHQIMDMKVLIPLDKEIDAPKGFEFSSAFKLPNALCIRHEGHPMHL